MGEVRGQISHFGLLTPAERRRVGSDSEEDHGELARDGDRGLSRALARGEAHAPDLER
jgi:hypothetical protein